MANGIRTIYSPRQRMAPGQYESPLADFLDNLPGYISQFQQNQLALCQQQIEDKRYEDYNAFRERKYEDLKTQLDDNIIDEENEDINGLGWIDGKIKKLDPISDNFPIPHVGWNDVVWEENSKLKLKFLL